MSKSLLGRKRVIAVDVDGVIVDSPQLWFKYLLRNYRLKYHTDWFGKDTLPYDLTKLFVIPKGDSGYEWWQSSDLYDYMGARADAKDWIRKLKDDGHKIIFVSHAIGNHHSSKENFIKKWFPYNDGVILTSNKEYVDCDYLIDDCYKNLNVMNSKVKCIKFRLDWKEEEEPNNKFPVAYNWECVYNFIKEGNKIESRNKEVYGGNRFPERSRR